MLIDARPWTRPAPIGPPSALHATLEAAGVLLVLWAPLAATAHALHPAVIGQGLLFVGPVAAAWLTWRARTASWRPHAAAALALAVFAGTTGAALFEGDVVTRWNPRQLSLALPLGLVTLLAAAATRLALALWQRWSRARRQRLVWALTHGQLAAIGVVCVLLLVRHGIRLSDHVAVRSIATEGLAQVVGWCVLVLLPTAILGALLALIGLATVLPLAVIVSHLALRAAAPGRTARLAHDVRTPLLAVRSALASARCATSRSTDADDGVLLSGALLGTVERQLGRAEALLGELDAPDVRQTPAARALPLDARADGASGRPAESFDAVGTTHAVVRDLRALAWRRDRVELSYAAPSGPIRLAGQALWLERALSNVIDNGSRHAGPGGLVRVTLHVDQRVLRIDVDDTGPGLGPARAAQALRAGVRGPSGGRSGLGLAIVRESLGQLAGRLRVGAAPGGGCRVGFTIERPRHGA